VAKVKINLYHGVVFVAAIFLCKIYGQSKKTSKHFKKIENIYKSVQHFDTEPEYYIEGHQSGCYYEIYVNDILVFKYYKNIGLANHATLINAKILKSGTQTVTVKLFPLGKVGGENYLTLDDDTRFELEIFKRDKTTPWEGLDYDVVKTYFAPTVTGEDTGAFKHAGALMYEETFTFEAKVPYELKGWSESQNLKNQEGLEEEVLTFYKNFGRIMSGRNYDEWERLIYEKEKEIAFSKYANKDDMKRIYRTYYANVKTNILEVQEIKDYELTYYANGNIVCLESKKLRKESALITIQEREYKGKPRKAYVTPVLYLHKPKDSNKLEIIR
jgi:hypothetical protein